MNIKELKSILQETTYKGWTFVASKTKGGDLYIQVQFLAWDNILESYQYQHGRKWYISNYAVKSEIVGTLLKAVLTAEEHEVRESFRYRNQPIFQTHYNVDTLADLCSRRNGVLETRENTK